MTAYKFESSAPSIRWLLQLGLITQIFIGLICGIALAVLAPNLAHYTKIFGEVFVNALKAIAPILVFVLVVSAIMQQRSEGHMAKPLKNLVVLYILGTFLGAFFSIIAVKLFPIDVTKLLTQQTSDVATSVTSVADVFATLLVNMVQNPVKAIAEANYIGLLVWAIALGVTLRFAKNTTKEMVADFSESISKIVRVVIRLAPIGVFGLVSSTLADTGIGALAQYASILLLLLGTMLFMALVVNPLIVYCVIRKNPFPWVFYCLKESGVPAFFTRSSAANVPVNIAIAKKMDFPEEIYSVAIPLGSVISMVGASVTITIFALVAAHSQGVEVAFGAAVVLCLVGTLCSMGCSGIAGGSLLLIPVAASLFGIGPDVAVQFIGIGMVISVLQDSTETALNSSTDLIYMGAICMREQDSKISKEVNVVLD